MFSIAIIDDDINELQHTKKMVLDYTQKRTDYKFLVQCFQSSYELLESVDLHGGFNIYILDIMMPVLDGIEVGKMLRQKDSSAIILYLTYSQMYAYSSYRVKARNYLLKPITEEELSFALDEIMDSLRAEDSKRFLLRNRKEIRPIPFASLLYVEYYNHRIRCYLIDGTVAESSQFRVSFADATAPLTSDRRFVKISSSHLVNMQHVTTISKNMFVLVDGTCLNITRTYANAQQKFFDYLLERGQSL